MTTCSVQFLLVFFLLCFKYSNASGRTAAVKSNIQPKEGPMWVMAPSSFSIKCTTDDIIGSAPEPTKWKKDGVLLQDKKDGYRITWNVTTDETNRVATSQLTVAKSKLENSGTYKCQPAVAGGDSVDVNVISVTEVNATITRGIKLDSVELRCIPETLNPDVESQVRQGHKWTKDGKILESTSHLVVHPDNYTIVIYNPKKEDAGQYNCEFELEVKLSPTGERTETLVKPVHLNSAPIIKQMPISENLSEDDTLQLNCVVLAGHPSPNVTWLKDGLPLSVVDDRVMVVTPKEPPRYGLPLEKSQLKIFDLKYEDRARYTCVVTNEYGSTNTTMLVRVKDDLAALYPFLAIVAEVLLLCAIMFICEKKRAKAKDEDDEVTTKLQSDSVDPKGKDEVRQRKT